MKKKMLIALLIVLSTLCFAEKWQKGPITDSWGEVTGTQWVTTAQITKTSSKGKDCKTITVGYIKTNDGVTTLLFVAYFEYLAPYASSGYVEVKDGPKVKAYVKWDDTLGFVIPLTLEEYRKSYEGKLVQLQWGNGEYITIKAPIWEE